MLLLLLLEVASEVVVASVEDVALSVDEVELSVELVVDDSVEEEDVSVEELDSVEDVLEASIAVWTFLFSASSVANISSSY